MCHLLNNNTHLSSSSPQSWSTLSENEVFNRNNCSCDVYKNRFIILAGGSRIDQRYGCTDYLQSVEIYDTETDKIVKRLPDLPFSGRSKGAILNGYFYTNRFADGFLYRAPLSLDDDDKIQDKEEEWEKVAEGLHKFSDILISDHKQYLFLLCYNGKMIRYDPVEDKCMEMPSMPTPRIYCTAAVVKSQIYVIGGAESDVVEVFDIPTQSWSQTTPMSQALEKASATAVKKRWIVVTGGFTDDEETNDMTYILDTYTHRWSTYEEPLSGLSRSSKESNNKCLWFGTTVVSLGGETMEGINIESLVPEWGSKNHLILLRRLVEDGRAHPSTEKSYKITEKEKDVIKILTMDACFDIFREVLTYFQ